MGSWHRMIYYLTMGDVTKSEGVLKTNANFIFHTLSFENSNKKWIKKLKSR